MKKKKILFSSFIKRNKSFYGKFKRYKTKSPINHKRHNHSTTQYTKSKATNQKNIKGKIKTHITPK